MSANSENADDLRELYSDVTIDHGKNPRNRRTLPNPDGRAEGFNRLCGDHITVEVKLGPEGIADAAFTVNGQACNICTASASMMTQAVKSKPLSQVEKMFDRFHEMLTAKDATPDEETLDKLVVFTGVKKYPMRVKCATLPWHTLKAALERKDGSVSTE